MSEAHMTGIDPAKGGFQFRHAHTGASVDVEKRK